MSRRLGFVSVAFAYFAVMAFSTLPSPLYGLYQARDGFSSFTVTLIYASYAVGVAAALVFAGHLSDWHGRRRVLLPAIALSLVSALGFLFWRDLPGLLLARVVNGLSVGVVAATATAWLAELHDVPRRAQLAATALNFGGLGAGPLIAGFLAQWVDAPLTVPYVVLLVALALAAVLVALTPETRGKLDPLPAYRPQRIAVPEAVRAQFSAAALAAFIAFGATGLFTGLAATFLHTTIGSDGHALAGVTVFAMFGGGVISQLVAFSWPAQRALASGMGLLVLGVALTVTAVWLPAPSLGLFIAGGAASGAGAGQVFKGALATVAAIAPEETRAEAIAGLFLAGYVGLSLPVVGAGIALQAVSPRVTLLGFGIVVVLGVVAAAPRLLERRVPVPA